MLMLILIGFVLISGTVGFFLLKLYLGGCRRLCLLFHVLPALTRSEGELVV